MSGNLMSGAVMSGDLMSGAIMLGDLLSGPFWRGLLVGAILSGTVMSGLFCRGCFVSGRFDGVPLCTIMYVWKKRWFLFVSVYFWVDEIEYIVAFALWYLKKSELPDNKGKDTMLPEPCSEQLHYKAAWLSSLHASRSSSSNLYAVWPIARSGQGRVLHEVRTSMRVT